ncbi:MAG: phospholipid carrier-dependent glycosyltransferase [Pseudoxanthomonas sp.]
MGNHNDASPGHFARTVELGIVWLLAVSLLGVASVLVGHFLPPLVLVGAALLTAAYAARVPRIASGVPQLGDKRHLLWLLLACLLFRLPPYHYVLGGQDQGVYVNMAHYIARTGAIRIDDEVLKRLSGSPFLQRYLAENYPPVAVGQGPRPERDSYLPGLYVSSAAGTRLDFQFYHLFPMWMALAIAVFGAGAGVYALTLFASLSVLFAYWLVLALSGSRRAALVAGLLLALNPLHAFFSKFPVTEVPTLAFSLLGFSGLAWYWFGAPDQRHRRWLALSAVAFGALFLTRISGFMYVPFVLAIAIVTAARDPDRTRSRHVQYWALAVLGLYASSVLYGLTWSFPYAADIYQKSFEPLFRRHWHLWVGMVVGCSLLAWPMLAVAARTARGRRVGECLIELARWAVAPALALALLLSLYKICVLGWTGQLGGNLGSGHLAEAGLPGSHWRAVKRSSMVQLLIYLGPLLPLAFLGGAWFRQRDPAREFVRVFASGFLVYVLTMQWVIPYGPYYDRYLLSEVVPYMLVYTVLWWASRPPGRVRSVLGAALGVSMLYAAGASAQQWGKSEKAGVYEALSKLLAPVGPDNLLLLETKGPTSAMPDSELKTPVLLTYGLPAVSVTRDGLRDRAYLADLSTRYGGVYAVTASPAPPPGFVATGSIRFKVRGYPSSHGLPRRLTTIRDKYLYLYRLDAVIP